MPASHGQGRQSSFQTLPGCRQSLWLCMILSRTSIGQRACRRFLDLGLTAALSEPILTWMLVPKGRLSSLLSLPTLSADAWDCTSVPYLGLQ